MGTRQSERARQPTGSQAAKLPGPVAAKQLERTAFVDPTPGAAERDTIVAAGKALQGAEIIKPDVDVTAVVDGLLQPSFAATVVAGQ